MEEIELLAPAGNIEIAKAALSAGADAVYLAGENFGARAYADNFTREELKEIIIYAHALNKKVYVTVNTIVFDDEFNQLIDYLDFLYLYKVDAVIVQDLGLVHLIKKRYPKLEIHASTQMHIHNLKGALQAKEMGISRVVLARETPLSLIKDIVDHNIEVETFIHGALCVSYSGQCNFSYQKNKRSANRGACIQNCRHLYRLKKDDEYVDDQAAHYLSMKDLNLLNHVGELIQAGISSFKIEGRMKSIDYVVNTVKAYRARIDKKSFDNRVLEQSYHRQFTDGHIFNAENIVNKNISEFKGEYIGEIISYQDNLLRVKLDQDINIGDGMRVIDGNQEYGLSINNMYVDGRLVKKAHKGELVDIFSRSYLKGKIYRTANAKLQNSARNLIIENPQFEVELEVQARIGQPLSLVIDHPSKNMKVEGSVVEAAKKHPLSSQRILEQLNKTGDSLIRFSHIELNKDENIFISIKEINQLRREILAMYEKNIIYREEKLVNYVSDKRLPSLITENIIINERFEAEKSTEFYVYEKVNEKGKYPFADKVVINDLGGFFSKAEIKIAGDGLILANKYTVDFLIEQGFQGGLISQEVPEHLKQEIKDYAFNKNFKIFEKAYGKNELMTMKYCPINPKRNNCNLCHRHRYCLENNEEEFILKGNSSCVVSIFEDSSLIRRDIDFKYIEFVDETNEEKQEILQKIG